MNNPKAKSKIICLKWHFCFIFIYTHCNYYMVTSTVTVEEYGTSLIVVINIIQYTPAVSGVNIYEESDYFIEPSKYHSYE